MRPDNPMSVGICPVFFWFGFCFVFGDSVQFCGNTACTDNNRYADHTGTVGDLPHDKVISEKRQKTAECPQQPYGVKEKDG